MKLGFKNFDILYRKSNVLNQIKRHQEASETSEEALNFDPEKLQRMDYKRRSINQS